MKRCNTSASNFVAKGHRDEDGRGNGGGLFEVKGERSPGADAPKPRAAIREPAIAEWPVGARRQILLCENEKLSLYFLFEREIKGDCKQGFIDRCPPVSSGRRSEKLERQATKAIALRRKRHPTPNEDGEW